jgi:valyl-tRNA synthetase
MLEKIYRPADIEARIHEDWMKAEAFKAGRSERAEAEPYCIVIPPPNVTGSLHWGHALNNTLQDVLCRFERMRGKDVLWQPGTDHAGIATQMVVERQLMERQQPDRHKLGREKFIERVWAWKAESGGTILRQLQRLGASCDWSRERFTMDEGLSKAVLKVFVELANTPGPDGRNLIYKDKRLVNWDPEFQTALSNLEVEMVDAKGSFSWTAGDPDKPFDAKALGKVLARNPNGHLYHFRYPLKDDPSRCIVVATTRPETMLGDTAVAVHPEDRRYKELVGKTAVLPLVGREIPIIADDYADPEKGSGAVKITPAHDFNDYRVYQRHPEIGIVNIFDATAHLNDEAPPKYRKMDRLGARRCVVEDLEAQGLVEKIESTVHAVPHAQRGNAVIEPWLTDQWYVDAAELAKRAMAVVEEGKTQFVPKNWEKTYFEWMRNIEPWCISRQIWWGHRIPAWYGPTFDRAGYQVPNQYRPFVAETEADVLKQARAHYGPGIGLSFVSDELRDIAAGPAVSTRSDDLGPPKVTQIYLFRDPDVLDTWFSSALWPFSTLGWPDKTPELERYYPTSTLVTAFDIIFFWVARMMMMGMHFMSEVPFHTVYIHAIVRDEKGAKMSKSKGNVADPLQVIDEYGADAFRFTLAAMAAQGRDIRVSQQRIEGYRNFATKLWNAARFAEMNECVRQRDFDPKAVEETLNRWIAGEVERTAAAVTAGIETYKFNEAATAIYEFTWGTFCDWYLELAKPILNGEDAQAKAETRATGAWVLDQILKLLHPFMPFITEELWARLVEVGVERQSLLCLSTWPVFEGLADADADEEIGWLVKLVGEVRSVRSEMNVPAGAKIPLVLVGANKATRARADHHENTIKLLARLDAISFAKAPPKGSAQIVLGEATAALPLAGVIDMGAERARLVREIDKAKAEIEKVDAKLANESFVAKAPPEVVEEHRERRAAFEATLARLQAALKRVEAAT